MKPLLNESMIQWSSKVHPKAEGAETAMVSVTGAHADITYTGYAEVPENNSDETFKAVTYLKAGITNLIVNALDEREMAKRAVFKVGDPMEIVGREDGYVARPICGVLDNNLESTSIMAIVEPPEGLPPDELEESTRQIKILMWTEWRQKELV